MIKRFTLKQYSTAAAALLAPAAAFSQAVYTDVDPDIVLDEQGEWWGFDLDGDGLNDFNFFNKSFSTTVWYSDWGEVKGLFAGVFDTMQNGLNGQTYYFSGNGGYTYYLPNNLESNELINDKIQFYNANYQTLAKTIYRPAWPPSTDNWGPWNSYFWGLQENKFIGFKFVDEDAITRYGWIRCSVVDTNRTLIIHDYAYESKPDTPILTGDTIGDTTTVSIQEGEFSGPTVYSFGNSVFINTPLNNVEYRILNLQGEVILNGQVTSRSYKLDLNTAETGIYLIECRQEKLRKTFKIFIEN
ncbi:MAG: T9SS type A sorting domain-containing protein [Chitinophagales bacterium]|nr:T9SS type A sorting domain-containing protein [Chitinophagales bacterium]